MGSPLQRLPRILKTYFSVTISRRAFKRKSFSFILKKSRVERKISGGSCFMKKNGFLVLFITINNAIVFLIIYKQNIFIKHSYTNQKLEKELELLETKKEELTQELYKMQNPNHVKEYAKKNLGMENLPLKRIRKIEMDTK